MKKVKIRPLTPTQKRRLDGIAGFELSEQKSKEEYQTAFDASTISLFDNKDLTVSEIQEILMNWAEADRKRASEFERYHQTKGYDVHYQIEEFFKPHT